MTVEIHGTSVDVLGKTYQIKCPENEVSALQKAAAYLEEKMQELRNQNHVLSVDRLAILAALNITHQLLHLEHEKITHTQDIHNRLNDLHLKIETLLNHAKPEYASE